MSEISLNCSIPLDDDKFLRRECPFCCREFKVLLEEEELSTLTQKCIDSFMLESKTEKRDLEQDSFSEQDFICPYCGQQAPQNNWWTQEQVAYFNIIAQNIMTKIVNEHLIRPLKRTARRTTSGIMSVQFKGNKIKQQEPWISPEINDMEIFDLPCCQKKIKIPEDWSGKVHCCFCGFPYIKE